MRIKNLRFVIFANDHIPAHVHVIGPDVNAKIDIETLKCISVKGFSEKDINMIIKFLADKRDILLDAWREYHEE